MPPLLCESVQCVDLRHEPQSSLRPQTATNLLIALQGKPVGGNFRF